MVGGWGLGRGEERREDGGIEVELHGGQEEGGREGVDQNQVNQHQVLSIRCVFLGAASLAPSRTPTPQTFSESHNHHRPPRGAAHAGSLGHTRSGAREVSWRRRQGFCSPAWHSCSKICY